MEQNWIDSELSGISLGDRRLNSRAKILGNSLAAKPRASIPTACSGSSETHAAYAFFANPKVSAEKILKPHISATLKRASEFSVVLAVQDTTSINFTGLKSTEGLGEVGDSTSSRNSRGLINHNTYLLTDEGVPLGLIDQDIWARETSKFKSAVKRSRASITDKESMKWLRSLRQVNKLTKDLKETRVIHVADREADIYELFQEAGSLNEAFIIRAKSNRRINKSSRGSSDGELLFSKLASTPPAGVVEVEVNDKYCPSRKRIASLELRTIAFEVTAPRTKSKFDHNFSSQRVPLTVVSAKEIKDDDGIDPIEWILLTNVEVTTLEQIEYCIKCYSKRWGVEVFHRILKTGCRIESTRFNSATKIKVYAAFLGIIAWRIHWMTLCARENPKAIADHILSNEDQNLLEAFFIKKKRGRKKKPSALDYLVLLARLGGFLARKGDGFPGAEVIWRGLTKLNDIKWGLNVMRGNDYETYV